MIMGEWLYVGDAKLRSNSSCDQRLTEKMTSSTADVRLLPLLLP